MKKVETAKPTVQQIQTIRAPFRSTSETSKLLVPVHACAGRSSTCNHILDSNDDESRESVHVYVPRYMYYM